METDFIFEKKIRFGEEFGLIQPLSIISSKMVFSCSGW